MINTPKGGWKLKRDSANVMVVWFTDGNIRTMYSLDWKHRFSKAFDKDLGWKRFHVLIIKYGDKAQGMLISKNDHEIPSMRTLLKLFSKGIEIPITKELKERIKNEFTSNKHKYT